MNETLLRELIAEVAAGTLRPEAALAELQARMRRQPFEDLGFARVDHHRALRQGAAEVILGRGKTPAQVGAIAASIAQGSGNVLITRATREMHAAVTAVLPEAEFHPIPQAITVRREPPTRGRGTILVISAGTSDLPVAEEAALTADLLGGPVETLYDCGVSGLHRLLGELDRIQRARIVIVVAGMEGALPSVVGGLVAAPVIAVPTSVGYGASFGGVAALLGMLNSCASNVTVVNIDNGFGAGFTAAAINRG
ncbi:MAG TPA: nickel pincer cofactor biosynthesis protein LarB [Terriglobales bacterium]|nr:nickel pincer cofactor biosynthesis protein LarB [Terriglobales bacterium]